MRNILKKEIDIFHPFGRDEGKSHRENFISIVKAFKVGKNSTIFFRLGTELNTIKASLTSKQDRIVCLELPNMLKISLKEGVVVF